MAARPTGRCPIEACRDARLIRRRVRTTKCACNCGASAESLQCSGCSLLFHRNDACFRLHVAEAELAAALYAKGAIAGAEPVCADEPSRKRLRKGSLCYADAPSPSLEMSMSMSTMSHNWKRKQSVASMPVHTERPSTTCLMSSSFSSTSTESLTPATSRASTPDHSVACSEDYTAILGSSSRQLLTSSCLRTLNSPILVTLQNSTAHSLCGFTVTRCCTCCTNRLPFTEPRTFSEPVLSLGEETQVLFTQSEAERSDDTTRPGLMHFEVQFSCAEGIESSKIYFLVDTKTGVVMLDKQGSTQPECTEWRASVAPMGRGGHHTRLLLAEVSPFAAMLAERRVNGEGKLQVGGAPTAEVSRWDWNAVGHRVRRDEAQHAVAAHPTVGASRARRFPEMRDAALLQRTSDSAVCLGSVGGTLRSYLCAVGAMRALHGLKLMGRVRYQNAASGGALASASFLYRDEALFSDQEVLGDLLYTSGDLVSAPLSMRRLGRAPSGLMTQAAVREHDARHARATQSSETWTAAVSARFLEPLGAHSAGVMAWSQPTLNDVLDRNSHLVDGDFAKQNANRPFSVFGSTLVAPAAMLPVPENAVDTQYAAFESTPLSAGVPVRERSVAYTKVGNASFTQRLWGGSAAPTVETQQAIVGGATVEPIGCGVPLKQRAADARGCPSLTASATALRHTLGGVVAASASLFAAKNVLPGGTAAAVPTTRYAAPLTTGAEAPAEFAVGDGSMVDALAVLPALRRQVRNVVVFVDPTHARFLDEPDLAALFARPAGDLQSPAPLRKAAAGDAGSWYACPGLQALFGFESAAKDGASYAGKTVFDGTFDMGGSRCGDALVHILQTWSRAVREGRPVVAQTDGLAVVDNAQHGVEAHECNVTWVCLLKAAPAAVLTKVVPDAFDEEEMVIPVTEQDCVCDVRTSGPWANPRNVGFNQYMSDTTWQEYQRTDSEAPFRCLSSPECDGGYSIEAANLLAEYQAWTLSTWLHSDPHGVEVAGRLRR